MTQLAFQILSQLPDDKATAVLERAIEILEKIGRSEQQSAVLLQMVPTTPEAGA